VTGTDLPGVAGSDVERGAADFEAVRRRLFGIAYRMLGSVAEAEDVVQEAWIRWQTADRSQIRSPEAYLSTVATRPSINVATSARVRREAYVGPWLPEPILTENDPALGAERTEALELGLLMLLERLNPRERAVYLLREAFDYSFSDIAEVLETSEANARQLGRRARLHLEDHRSKQVARAERNQLLQAFLAAARVGDLQQLERLLTQDVVVYSDGGGVVTAARRPIVGLDKVTRFLVGAVRKLRPDGSIAVVQVNGEDAVIIRGGAGEPTVLCTIGAGPDGIDRVYLILNPAKLARLEHLSQ
jgi:RNA polymerase sigma-70 factor (ECF subfamily)